MPIIFAQAIMFAPAYIGGALGNTNTGQWLQIIFGYLRIVVQYSFWFIDYHLYVFLYLHYAPTNRMSDDLKARWFIPGIRPGNELLIFRYRDVSHHAPSSLFLALLAVFPAIVVKLIGMQQG